MHPLKSGFVFALMGLVPPAASAAPFAGSRPSVNKCSDLHQAEFFRADSPEWAELSVPVRTVAASLHIKSEFSRCSSTRVSKGGHVLTALHCVDECLKKAGAMETVHDAKLDVDYLVRKGDRASWGKCKLEVEGVGPVEFEIEAFGKCSYGSLERFANKNLRSLSKEQLAEFRSQHCSGEEDYALLRSPKMKGTDAQCLPVARTVPTVGAEVFSAGYPGKTNRPKFEGKDRNSDGKSFVVDRGEIIEENSCEKIVSKSVSTVIAEKMAAGEPMPEDIEKFVEEHSRRVPERDSETVEFSDPMLNAFRREKLIQTTADAVQGSSGGSLISVDGTLIGVTQLSRPSDGNFNLDFECRGASFYLPSATVIKKIEEQLPKGHESKIDEMFDCGPAS